MTSRGMAGDEMRLIGELIIDAIEQRGRGRRPGADRGPRRGADGRLPRPGPRPARSRTRRSRRVRITALAWAAVPYVIAAFIAAALLALVLTPLVRAVALRVDAVDKPDHRRVNLVPLPRGGGVAVAAAFIAVVLAFLSLNTRFEFVAVPTTIDTPTLIALLLGGALAVGCLRAARTGRGRCDRRRVGYSCARTQDGAGGSAGNTNAEAADSAAATSARRGARRARVDGARGSAWKARRVPRDKGIRPQHPRARRQGRERRRSASCRPPRSPRRGRREPTTTPARGRERSHDAGLYLIGRVVRSPTRRSAGAPAARVAVARRLRLARPGRARVDEPLRQARLEVHRRCRRRRGEGRLRRDPVRLRPVPERRRPRLDRLSHAARNRRLDDQRFFAYASKRLRPLGVRVSADLFGLAATRDLGVGQSPTLHRATWTRSTRWSTPRTTCPASTASSTRTPPWNDGGLLPA